MDVGCLWHGGARENAGRKAKDREDNSSGNLPLEKPKRNRGNGNADPERVIARLKRDAETNPNAQALLDTLSAGDISARQKNLKDLS